MSTVDGNGRVIVGCGLHGALVDRGEPSNRGERVVVGCDNPNWDLASRTWKTESGDREVRWGEQVDDRDWFTKICDVLTGTPWNQPPPIYPASLPKCNLTNDSHNMRVLLKSLGTPNVVAKRDRSNDRNAVDLARDVYSATESASARDWPSAAYYSTEVARDLIDVGRTTGEDFVESRTEAVKGGYSEYSDIGFQ